MSTMQALVLDAENRSAHVKETPIPTPGPNDLLIKVSAIALNPVDSLYTANPLGSTGRVVGSDFAGTIVSLPADLPASSTLEIGDRVAGFLQGACSVNDRPGAFAEYLICPWDLVWKVPEGMSREQAATISLCGLTAAQAIIPRLGLEAPFPWSGGDEGAQAAGDDAELIFFIYAASTSVGMYAAQLVRHCANASGRALKLLGAASKSRWPMLKAAPFSYDVLVDYHDSDWPDQIRAAAGERGIDYAYDGISEDQTVAMISQLLRPGGGLAIVRSREAGAWSPEGLAEGIDPIYGAVWEGLGEEVQYQGLTVPASKEARGFAVAFYQWLSEGGGLAPNPVRVMPGGLENVVSDGFTLLGFGKIAERKLDRKEDFMRPVGAEKLVYRIS